MDMTAAACDGGNVTSNKFMSALVSIVFGADRGVPTVSPFVGLAPSSLIAAAVAPSVCLEEQRNAS